MSLQIRRGTAAEQAAIIPAIGELIYATDTKVVYIGDGVTGGGIPVGKPIVAGQGIIYNSATGVISSVITTQYTDSFARASLSFAAGSGAYNSTSGLITIPTNTSHLTNGAGFATETFVNTAVSALVASAPATLDTLNELAAALGNDASYSTTISTSLGNRLRVDINTQGLDTTQKANAATNLGLATVATSGSYTDLTNKPTTYTDSAARASLSFTAGSGAYNSSTGVITIPTNTSQLTNGAGFITASDITGKQATLISGTNIKTINGTSILGSGDITISGGGGTSLPTQTGNSGKYLSTDGTTLSWSTVAGGGGGGTTTNKLSLGVGLVTTSDIIRTIPNNITPANTQEYFGNATAVDATYTVVAARAKSVAAGNSGEVYIYSNATGNLLYKVKNPNPNGSASDYFGWSISLSGNYLIVGAPYEGNTGSTNSDYGAVHVYDITTFTAYSGTTITVTSATRTILNPQPVSGDRFGMSVALSGTNLVIGTPLKESGDEGRAYIYNVTTGTLLYTINDPTAYSTVAGDRFGWSVAIKDNTVIIGAPGESDSTGNYAGKAYVFNLSTFPASPATITSSTYTSYGYVINNPNIGPNSFTGSWSNDDFGTSVSVNSAYVAVGSPGDKSTLTDAAPSAGRVYVFNKTTGTLVYSFSAPTNFSTNANDVFSFFGDLTTGQGNRFGHCIAMSDTHLLTGSKNSSNSVALGMAYLFDLANGTLVKDFINPNYNTNSTADGFGSAVSIYNSTYMVIGAPLDNYNMGCAFFFQPKLAFDGSTGLVVGLGSTGAIGGTYGSGTWGGTTAYIPTITVDSFGRVISATQTQVMLGQTPPNSFVNIQANGATAFNASSTNDTLNFVGTGATTVTASTSGSGIKTITIDSTASSGGDSGSATTYQISSWSYQYGQFTIVFNSQADAEAFQSAIGTNATTIQGYTGSQYMSGSFTVTPAGGSSMWQSTGSISVSLNAAQISPTIGGSSDTGNGGSISFGGAGGSGPTWSETTSSYNQGSTTISYGIVPSGQYIFVAFFGPMISSSWIMNPSGGPNNPNWSSYTGSDFIVYRTMSTSPGSWPTSESWTFSNNNHMLYCTWASTDSPMNVMMNNMSQSNSSFSYYNGSMDTKTNYVLLGSSQSMLDFTNTSSVSQPLPSGYSVFGTAAKHSQSPSLSVTIYKNATPPTMNTINWYISNMGYMSYSSVAITTG